MNLMGCPGGWNETRYQCTECHILHLNSKYTIKCSPETNRRRVGWLVCSFTLEPHGSIIAWITYIPSLCMYSV